MNSDFPSLAPISSPTQNAQPSAPPGTTRGLLLLATVVTMGLWFVPYSQFLLYPLRLFVTFIHESGHALTAIAVGGDVLSLTVRPDTSGVTQTATPPWALGLVYSGGYLGATLFGALMLQVGRGSPSSNRGRIALYAIACSVLVITLLWAHNPFTNLFTLVVGLFLAGCLFLCARYTTARGASFIAGFLAVQCSLNALSDLRDLLYQTSQHLGDNDAVFMSRAYPFPPTFWAVVWAVMALVILGISLRSYWRATDTRTQRMKAFPAARG